MSRWRLFYHVVWATNGREPIITVEREPVIHHHVRTAAERQQIIVHAVGGIADHVHMAISIPPTIAIADAMHRIKGASSRAINEPSVSASVGSLITVSTPFRSVISTA